MDDLKITYYGHACFKVESNGLSVVFDPVDEETGYVYEEKIKANKVFISHSHHDHSNLDLVEIVDEEKASEIPFMQIKTFHDNNLGAKRGSNMVTVLDINDYRICHLGDLGHDLSKADIDEIGNIDVLFIPCGGIYTIDGKSAAYIARKVDARVIIPMHYKTPKTTFNLDDISEFWNAISDLNPKEVPNTIEISRDEFSRLEKDNLKDILVMDI
ncbi:MAG: MBL fold metallo-hydrolase [Clostridia bacterium]|nr:MBL fold metallo-hydrolase [Clostridia bacterium]